jgi:D-alanyl-D-alanine carboxypeptidase (penicillin-binding protein 5/6)
MALAGAPLWSGSAEGAFYAARAVGLVELLLLVVVVWRLTQKSLPGRPGAAALAAAAVGLNPMLLAMSTSIQNDTLAILLAAAAVDVATSGEEAGRRRAFVVGLLVGLAMLTKITAWPAGAVLGAWLLWRRGWRAVALYAATVLVVAGWWFVRNLDLYGDLTGRGGVEAAGYDFPAIGVDPVHVVRDVVTYLWVPTEYVRNTVSAPALIELVVVLLTLVAVVGAVAAARVMSSSGWLLTGIAVVAVIGWVVVLVAVQGVAFRFAYVALPAWFIWVGGVTTLRSHRWLLLTLLAAGVVTINVWFLVSLGNLDVPQLLDLSTAGR